MTIAKHSMERFIRCYTKYFGKAPIITETGNFYRRRVEGIQEILSIRNMCHIAIFYSWRLQKSKTYKDPFEDDDFKKLQQLVDKKIMTQKAASVALGIYSTTFNLQFKHNKDIKTSYEIVKDNLLKIPVKDTLTWQGETKTIDDWAATIPMSPQAFRNRFIRYGACDIIFLNKAEFSKVPDSVKKKFKNTTYKKKEGGNKVYQKLSRKDPINPIKRGKYKVEYKQALYLISYLIEDAKENMLSDNKFAAESKRFLMNGNGQLKWLLESVHDIELNKALEELYEYATEGYKGKTKKLRTSRI